jgi:hypothetical protein
MVSNSLNEYICFCCPAMDIDLNAQFVRVVALYAASLSRESLTYDLDTLKPLYLLRRHLPARRELATKAEDSAILCFNGFHTNSDYDLDMLRTPAQASKESSAAKDLANCSLSSSGSYRDGSSLISHPLLANSSAVVLNKISRRLLQ